MPLSYWAVKENTWQCSSKVNLTGVNSNVIISGWKDDNPDNERQEATRRMQRVYRSELTVIQAAQILGISERHCYRLKAQVIQDGARAVVHDNRGRPCARKIKERIVEWIVALANGKYKDFNDHHLAENLQEQEKIKLSREKLRQILRSHGIASPRNRRGDQDRLPAGTRWWGGRYWAPLVTARWFLLIISLWAS
jgi:transposase